MTVATLRLDLRFRQSLSARETRRLMQGIMNKLRKHFNVSVAELDPTNLWNRATVGVVAISDTRDYLDGLMKNVERQANRITNNAGAEIADSFVDYL